MISIFLSVLLTTSNAFPGGAPATVCDSMKVMHKGISAQQTSSPFEVTTTRDGKQTLVSITTDTELNFQGLMLQAHTSLGHPTGIFELLNDTLLHTVSCLQPRDTVTHSNTELKSTVQVRWMPVDGYTGTIVFQATIAQTFAVFWVGVQSKMIEVDSTFSQTESHNKSDAFYEGCAVSKLCFGLPDGCVENTDCAAVVAIAVGELHYEFEMKSERNSAWIGVGLSEDNKMGDDSVLECVKENNIIAAYMSWNTPRPNLNTIRLPNPQDGIRLISGRIVDNSIYCKVFRDYKTYAHDKEFDLINGEFYILLGVGSTLRENAIGYHNLGQISSQTRRRLSDVRTVTGTSNILLKLHGIFMVTAWLCTSSLGTFIARHYRKTWVGRTLCGKDVWFHWHRLFMIATFILTSVGFILIYIELNDWTTANNLHSICGCAVAILCLLESIGGFIRPPPHSSRRQIFNWLHWLTGNTTHILAIIAIFLATDLKKIQLSETFVYILAIFVVFHFFTNFVLAVMGHLSATSASSQVTAFPTNDSRIMVDKIVNMDAPYSGLRKLLLYLYALGVCGLGISLVAIIIVTPIV